MKRDKPSEDKSHRDEFRWERRVREHLTRFAPYVPPRRGDPDALWLDFNESTQPPPPGVIAHLQAYLARGRVRTYPDEQRLLPRLAAYASCKPSELLLTNGSDQALEIVLRALLAEGDELVYAHPTFAMIPHFAAALNARQRPIPYPASFEYPLNAVREAISPKTRLLILVNPNNPTTTLLPPATIAELAATFPRLPILVDEAYYEFSRQTVVSLIGQHPNMVVTRTFSKALAIAGLRLGYVIADAAFIALIRPLRGPFDVNSLAIEAALALLADPKPWQDYAHRVMHEAHPQLASFFRRRGIPHAMGPTNFALFTPPDRQAAQAYLVERGIHLRPMAPPLANMLRVSIGLPADVQRFTHAYQDYLDAADAHR